ncbi:hypothetical protein SK128_019937 [Halocaridina rubra]|uniref:Uncharacterized protein n=1 Tax=Halocaridina rubra TaxID=373956 RepID=A0AAN8X8Z4_HALRR
MATKVQTANSHLTELGIFPDPLAILEFPCRKRQESPPTNGWNRSWRTRRVVASRHRPQPPTVIPSHSSNLPSKQLKLSCLDGARSVERPYHVENTASRPNMVLSRALRDEIRNLLQFNLL